MIKLILPLVLIVGIVAGVYLVQNRVNFFPRADEGGFGQKVTISNLAPTSLSISYFTASPSVDFIQYGENTDVPTSIADFRSEIASSKLNTHYFRLENLKPDTKYYFKIHSGERIWPEDSYLTFKTPALIEGNAGFEGFSGTVKKKEGAAVAEGIVFLSSDNGQLLSAPVGSDGKWGMAFSGMRSEDMSRYFSFGGTEQIKFFAYAGREGFGLFGQYALKKSDIGITVADGAVPFYKINLGQQPVNVLNSGEEQQEKPIWVRVQDFLKGAF